MTGNKQVSRFTRALTIAIMMVLVLVCSAPGIFAASKPKAPAKVTGVKAKTAGDNAITVKWKKVKKGAKGYAIYRDGVQIAKVSGAKTMSFTDTGLDSGTKYYYSVRAYKTYKVKKWFNNKTGKWTKKKPSKKHRGPSQKETKYRYSKNSATVSVKTSGLKSVGRRDADSLDPTTLRNELLAQMNAQRAAAGVPPLEMMPEINALADIKVQDMYARGELSHESPTLGEIDDQLRNAGIGCGACGENIAWGQRSVSEVMECWMASTGHRKNILYPVYTHVGLAYYGGFWVQQFVANPRINSGGASSQTAMDTASEMNDNIDAQGAEEPEA